MIGYAIRSLSLSPQTVYKHSLTVISFASGGEGVCISLYYLVLLPHIRLLKILLLMLVKHQLTNVVCLHNNIINNTSIIIDGY